ncbi:hypothetical protein KPLM21_450074 [Klebsiella pneumoniae]|nr:hypothetical protein KPLM21_450074 [Klebsiella pneumoniae]CTQ27827.1 hypothetical protein CH1034_190310 [Klebsiella pneumoniae]SBN35286.1 hypothetical protein KPMX200_70298 [Klebsiella pneumoniae]
MFKKSEHRIRYIALSLWRDCEYSVNKHQGIDPSITLKKGNTHEQSISSEIQYSGRVLTIWSAFRLFC